jgi:hypothetical protein
VELVELGVGDGGGSGGRELEKLVELGVEAEEVEGRNWWNWEGQEEVEAEELEKLVELGVEQEVESGGGGGEQRN